VASVNTVTDQYILQAQIDDQTAGTGEAIVARLAKIEAAGKSAGAAAGQAAAQMQDAGGRVNLAAAQFERMATKYDAVTKASVALARAQQELNVTQETGNRAVQNGYATQEQLDATMAALAKKVSDLATKLGEARAQAQANAAAQDAWNGKIAGGTQVVAAFAQGVANAAQAAKEAQAAFSAWLSGGMSQDAGIQRFNTNLQSFIGSLKGMRDSFDPASAATSRFQSTLKDLLTLQSYGIGVSQGFFKAVTEAAAGLKGSATDLAAMAAAVDPVVAAERAYLEQVGKIKAAVDARATSQERGAELIAAEAAAFDKAYAAVTGYTEAQQRAKAAVDAENAAWADLAKTQADYLSRTEQTRAKYDETFAAQQKQAAALAALTEASERYGLGQQWVAEQMAKVTAAMNGSASAINAQRAAIDPLYRVSMQYGEQLKNIQKTADDGIITQQRANVLMDQATAAFARANAPLNQVADAHKNIGTQAYYNKFATQQATVQFAQFVSQISTGQPFLLALIQQGHQLFDVAMVTGTGFGTLANAVKSAFSTVMGWAAAHPIIAVITALGAATVAFAAAGELAERRLMDLRNSLAATRQSYADLATQTDAAARVAARTVPGVDFADASKAGTSIAGSINWGGTQAQLVELITVAQRAAVMLGQTLPEQAKFLAEALEQPGKAAQELADKHLFGMNQAMAESVARTEALNGKGAAFGQLVDTMSHGTQAVTQNITPLSKALHDLGALLSTGFEPAKSQFRQIGEWIAQGLAIGVEAIVYIGTKFEWLQGKINDFMQWLRERAGQGTNAPSAPLTSLPGRGNLPAGEQQVLLDAINAASARHNLDPAYLAAVQREEGVWKDNRWQTSSAGAVGAFQVMPDLLAGMLRQPGQYPTVQGTTDLSNTSQNANAGAAYLAHLLQKYGDPTIAVLAYHDGETAIDKLLASRGTKSPLDAAILGASQAAIDEATRVAARYTGTGFAAALPTPATSAPSIAGGSQDTHGGTNASAAEDLAKRLQNAAIPANDLLKAADAVRVLQEHMDALTKSGVSSGLEFDRTRQSLDAANKSMYDAIPATDKEGRAIDQQVVANKALTAAYGEGLSAVQRQVAANQAKAQVDQSLAPNTRDYALAVEQLTQKNLELIHAQAQTDTTKTLEDTKRQTEAVKTITQAILDGEGPRARQIAQEAARATLISQNLVPGDEGYSEQLAKQTQANLDLARAEAQRAANQALVDTKRQVANENELTAAIAAGDMQRATTAARQKAQLQLVANGLIPTDENYTKTLQAQTQANLDLAQAEGKHQVTQQLSDLKQETDARLRVADAYKTSEGAAAAAEAHAEAEAQVRGKLIQGTDEYKAAVDQLTASILAKNAADAQVQIGATEADLKRQTSAQDELTAAYKAGPDAVRELTAREAARAEALAAKLIPNTLKYNLAVEQLTKDNLKLMGSTGSADIEKLVGDTKQQTEATSRIAAAYDGSATSLDHLQNLEKARAAALPKLKEGSDAFNTAVGEYSAALDAAAASNRVLEKEQSSVSAVAGIATNAFDQLGQALTDAFVSSSGQAVNWGNVLKGILASVIAQIVKLGVVAPIVNSLFNQNQPTLETGLSVLGRQSGGGGSSFSLGNLSSLGGAANTLTGGSIYSWLGTSLVDSGLVPAGSGIIGAGGSLTGAGGLFYGGMGAANAVMASAPLGAGVAGPVLADATASSGAGALGTLGSTTIMGAGLGSWAGGIGAGFTAGSMAGGAIQNALGKTGPAPMIGAGLGAVGGAAIGTMILPGIGTIVGGLIGGTLGGAGGGLIGPKAASPYSSLMVNASQGTLHAGQFLSQKDPNAAQEIQAYAQQIQGLNDLMTKYNVWIGQQKTAMIQFGNNTPGKFQDPTKFADLNTANITGKTALQQFGFTASDPILAQKLGRRDFATTQDLQTYLQTFTQVQAAFATGMANTSAVLKDLGVTTGSVNDTIKQLNDTYAANKANGDSLINSGFLSDDQVKQMVKAENDLAAARDKAIQQAEEQANQQVQQEDQGRYVRRLQANAQTTGFAGDALGVQLINFDAQASQQRQALSQELVSLYGDAVKSGLLYANEMTDLENTLGQERLSIVTQYNKQIADAQAAVALGDQNELVRYAQAHAQVTGSQIAALNAQLNAFDVQAQQQRTALDKQIVAMYGATIRSTAGYGNEMAMLERTLGEERLAIQKQYNEQLAQQAQASVSNLANYAQKLLTSNQSPLSPTAQYQLSSNQFNAVLGAARAGDYNSLQNITTYADSLLQASSAYFGTGTQYVSDFKRVLDAINSLASMTPDQLTAAVYRQETRSATQQLVDSLAQIRAEVAALRSQVAQGSLAPSRLAA
jgi:Transglycosylase SLT domain